MLFVRGYFDDAGTHADSEVVVIGGLFGVRQQWEKFEEEWQVRLNDPLPGYGKPPLKKFHLSHCNARVEEFADYSDAEQNAVIHDFRQIIIDAQLASVATAIDRRAWDELVVGPYRRILGEPLGSCMIQCVDEVIRVVDPNGTGEHDITVMFDKGIWSPALQHRADLFEKHKMVSVTFGRVQKFLPLQGADIVATENYWHAAEWLKLGDAAPPRPHLRHYLDNMLHEGLILDREALAEEVRRRGPDGRAPE
jgi:hypothetical protein